MAAGENHHLTCLRLDVGIRAQGAGILAAHCGQARKIHGQGREPASAVAPNRPLRQAPAMTTEPPHPQLDRLLQVIDRLRSPGGCPWDREQTPPSMAPHLLEEAYEAVEALQREDTAAACEELGDVLMNVLMIARIASESDAYDLERVSAGIADKLIRRHPHVFGDAEVDGSDQVLANWEAIKRQEKEADEEPRGVLSGVPDSLPALLRAHRVGEKAARTGFDWPDMSGPREKLAEELRELDQAIEGEDLDALEYEIGDVLFSVVNIARRAGVNSEMALRRCVQRFTARFEHIERSLGERLETAELEEMEALWQQAKDLATD